MVYKRLYADHAAALDIADVDDDVDMRRPRLELSLPRDECRQRNNEKEWTVDVIGVHQHRQECNDLYRLSKSHLIGQNNSILSAKSTRPHISSGASG